MNCIMHRLLATSRPSRILITPNRRYKVTINNVRIGNVIEFRGKPHVVTKATHSVMGRGSAHVKLDLKDVVSGNRITERFKTSDSVEGVHIHSKSLQYLYHDEESVYVLDPETYEQHVIPVETMNGGDKVIPFLLDSTPLTVSFLDNHAITAKLPSSFVYEIEETTDKVKGGTNPTAKGIGHKVAKLTGGLRVEVPDFCVTGDKIEVSVDENWTLNYIKRVK